MHKLLVCLLSTEMIAIPFVLWERHSNKAWMVVFMKGFFFPFWSYFPNTLYDTFMWYFSVPVTECYVKRKRKETWHFVLHTRCQSAWILDAEWSKKKKKLIRVLVIISYSSNTNSTPERLQIVYLSEMTGCLSKSTILSQIIQHLSQTYISIKAWGE